MINHVFYFLGVQWQYCNVNGPFPDRMVRGGIDSDGSVIFVGRAFHEGDMMPCKIIPSKVYTSDYIN